MNITPLPWIAEDHGHGIYIEPACVWLGNTSRHSNEVVRANAEYIVRAVNSHAELLAALEGVDVLYAELSAALPAIANTPAFDRVQAAVKNARAAIAKAKS